MANVAASISRYSKLNSAAILQCDSFSVFAFPETTPGTAQNLGTSIIDGLSVLRIVPVDCDIWVKIGPGVVTAAAGDGFLVRDGMVEYFAVNIGDTISIFEAL